MLQIFEEVKIIKGEIQLCAGYKSHLNPKRKNKQ